MTPERWQQIKQIFQEALEKACFTRCRYSAARRLLSRIDTPVTFSPDGKRLAFMRKYPGVGEFALMSAGVDGSDEQKLVAHQLPEMIAWPAWSPDGKTIAYGVRQPTADGSSWRLFELRSPMAARLSLPPCSGAWSINSPGCRAARG